MNNRVGGLAKATVDPAVADWLKDAQTNKAALTKKQKRDMNRLRVIYDLSPNLKTAIERAARRQGTSASQMAAFLLAFAIKELAGNNPEIKAALLDGKSPSATMKFEWNLDAPEAWRPPES
jgi:hypothetical protein